VRPGVPVAIGGSLCCAPVSGGAALSRARAAIGGAWTISVRFEIDSLFFDFCFDSHSNLSFPTSIYTCVGSDTFVGFFWIPQCTDRVVFFHLSHELQQKIQDLVHEQREQKR